ncbi:hypothetical protein KQ1_05839 [Bacillus cereus BAG3O-1]|nr:hypothetical protein KQ1_05839 [Bacillus cereus BAG3O-1]
MKGSVKKDKKVGKYFYIVDIGIDPLTGKRKQNKKRGFTSKKAAENALAKLLSEVHTGTYIENLANSLMVNIYKIGLIQRSTVLVSKQQKY